MTIGAGETILAADIQAIKDDVDKLTDAADDQVATDESTTSTTFTDLTTSGPAVTVTTGTIALVVVTAAIHNNTANAESSMSFEVTGASSVAASETRAVQARMTDTTSGATKRTRASYVGLITSLTAGSNTFTAKYKVDSGTGNFENREIIVIPIGA